MQKLSKDCDGSSVERATVAQDLYIEAGATSAAHRFSVNSSLGDFDLTTCLTTLLDLRPGMDIADVGCGSGGHLAHFQKTVEPGGAAVGFDISADAVASARAQGLNASVADAADLPLDPESLNALSCNFAIYYHPRLFDTLTEFKRVLRSGGRLVISGPALGTNAELYDFHRRATGAGPSDADLMGIGYIEDAVLQAASDMFANCRLEIHTNNVGFPDASSFLEYWRATSLFRRTPGASFEAGQRLLEGRNDRIVVTKKIAILIANA